MKIVPFALIFFLLTNTLFAMSAEDLGRIEKYIHILQKVISIMISEMSDVLIAVLETDVSPALKERIRTAIARLQEAMELLGEIR